MLMAIECALRTGHLPRGGLPRNSVDRITDRPDMTSAADCEREELTQPTNLIILDYFQSFDPKLSSIICCGN